jgi:hypothetical protein
MQFTLASVCAHDAVLEVSFKPGPLQRSCEETHRALSKRVSARVFVNRIG